MTKLERKLRARAHPALRVKRYRVGRLLRRLQEVVPLREEQLPLARAWCEHEVLAADLFALLERDGLDRRLLDSYRAIRQSQLQLAAALGMTPMARREASRLAVQAALVARDQLRRALEAPQDDAAPPPPNRALAGPRGDVMPKAYPDQGDDS